MQLGMIGLGRMGANMVRRLIKGGHQCVVFDRSPDVVQDLVKRFRNLPPEQMNDSPRPALKGCRHMVSSRTRPT